MNRLVSNNTAFSLMEILVASIIFIISIGGIFATLNAVRAPVINKESSLSAAVFGKQVLESLRSQVIAGTNVGNFYGTCSSIVSGACRDFSLYLGLHQVPTSSLPSGLSWPPALVAVNTVCGSPAALCLQYTVSCADGIAPSGSPPSCSSFNVARRINLNINW